MHPFQEVTGSKQNPPQLDLIFEISNGSKVKPPSFSAASGSKQRPPGEVGSGKRKPEDLTTGGNGSGNEALGNTGDGGGTIQANSIQETDYTSPNEPWIYITGLVIAIVLVWIHQKYIKK